MELPKNFLLINKPLGWTSFDMVGYIRKKIAQSLCHPEQNEGSLKLGVRDSSCPTCPTASRGGRAVASLTQNDKRTKRIKVGHAGTLDPFATGLLIVGVGREATKRLDEFKNLPKTYVATIHLGATSDTGDPTGKITEGGIINRPDIETVQAVLKTFLGQQLQTPPMHSAKSVGGVRLYKLARQGKKIERQPSKIEIINTRLVTYSYPELKIEVTCSSGTYIRTLAEDIGKKLGTSAYCEELTRTKIGEYALAQAQTPAAALTIITKMLPK
ncbi:MAG: tRNA pseudouridine(55) synthase TruB [Candidatus Magasanikbacteria bacterium]|nr:tRNA pseudouridine(55) synthase TruB [Candidatus Magasanikbacteria bacterium]